MTRRGLLTAGAAAAATAALPAVPARASGPSCTVRYAGYRADDRTKPWASFFEEHTAAPQPQVTAALAAPPLAADAIPPLTSLGSELARRDADQVETGYGRTPGGRIYVAVLTDMPGVRPEMWDWWFAWHSDDSSKYKLWHPDAHQFASLRREGPADTYIGMTSYVDELIGPHLQQLAIAFVEPSRFYVAPRPGETVICGTVGSSILPLNAGVLAHQVRPTPAGSEMRSRFYLNVYGSRPFDLSAAGCAVGRGIPLSQSLPPFDLAYGRLLLEHCGREMHHLARFLPELYARFG